MCTLEGEQFERAQQQQAAGGSSRRTTSAAAAHSAAIGGCRTCSIGLAIGSAGRQGESRSRPDLEGSCYSILGCWDQCFCSCSVGMCLLWDAPLRGRLFGRGLKS